MTRHQLEVPPHFDADKVGEVWKVDYQLRAAEARAWAQEHNIAPSAEDAFRLCLVLIDVQNTFCLPDFELYVAGRSGTGAIDDNRRLCAFIYRNLGAITEIAATLDSHSPLQIFHPVYLINDKGEHPDPLTLVSAKDIEQGRWKFNPAVAHSLGIDPHYGQRHLIHYVNALKGREKYDLTIWPYHAMLGGIGHALVAAVEEAVFFHSIARNSQPNFQVKGRNPLTEAYSALGPEVLEGPDGEQISAKNTEFVDRLLGFDAVVMAGQAKSHCVAWTVEDLLSEIRSRDPSLAEKIYLLEDCTSPVVVPDVVDFTEPADEAFQHFAAAGMHLVQSTEPLENWPGIKLRQPA